MAKSNNNFESNINQQSSSTFAMSSSLLLNNSSAKLDNGLSTSIETTNFKQQIIAPNNQSNFNKLKNINSSINEYVSNENAVDGINNMQLILNNNQNNTLHDYINNRSFLIKFLLEKNIQKI